MKKDMTKRRYLPVILISLFSISFVKAQETPTVPPTPPPPPPNTIISIYGIDGHDQNNYPSQSRGQTNSDPAETDCYLQKQKKKINS